MSRCEHKREDTWELIDAQGIYCARVCEKCERAVMATYTPQTFSGYDQSDVDERIEPEETLTADNVEDTFMPDECEEDRDSAPGCWGEDAPFYAGLG